MNAEGGKFGLLLAALVALMAASPLIITSSVSNAFLSMFTGAVLVASVHAARPGGRAVAIGVGLALADFLIGRCTVWSGSHWFVLPSILLWISTLAYATATILKLIFTNREVTMETLMASLCVFLLIGLIAVFAFAFIDYTLPGSFQSAHGPAVDWSDERSRATEFMRLFVLSYGTLSGAGFAEFTPATGFASNAASLEAMTGQIYLAVVIARLVGLHASTAGHGAAGRGRSPGPADAARRDHG